VEKDFNQLYYQILQDIQVDGMVLVEEDLGFLQEAMDLMIVTYSQHLQTPGNMEQVVMPFKTVSKGY
jgi:hypothetical protein